MQATQVRSLGQEHCPGEGHGYPLWFSSLENSLDRGAWWSTVHGVAKSPTQLSNQHWHQQLASDLYSMACLTIQAQSWPTGRLSGALCVSNTVTARPLQVTLLGHGQHVPAVAVTAPLALHVTAAGWAPPSACSRHPQRAVRLSWF